jgi:hypothetical protein
MNAVLVGILGPLVAVGGSWPLMTRTFRRDPAQLTSMMMLAFAVKMVFFAAYVALAVAVLAVPPAPFVASFTCAFVALYAVEAVALRRLLAGR